jgi:hypothetical protein
MGFHYQKGTMVLVVFGFGFWPFKKNPTTTE